MNNKADIDFALEVCRMIEEFAPMHGYHVALTGGTLYKSGARKDVDLLFYSIRQEANPLRDSLEKALELCGFCDMTQYGWMTKATYKNVAFDLFYPEVEKTEQDGGSGEVGE